MRDRFEIQQGGKRTGKSVMSRGIHKLNRNLVKGLNEPGRYNDGGGLYLMIRKSGLKTWVYRYSMDGQRRDMGLGTVSTLNDIDVARKASAEARVLVKEGRDPLRKKAVVKKAVKKDDAKLRTFGEVLDDFFTSKEKTGHFRTERTRRRWYYNLHTHAKPLHRLPISQIETRDVYAVLEPMWVTKTETAGRTRLNIEHVLSWAKTMGLRADPNPAVWRGNLDQLLLPKERVSPSKNHPAMPWQDVPEFMTRLRKLHWPSAGLLEFIILTASRSGEATGALWSEIDLERGVWEISAERMKMKRPHIVPISGRFRALIAKQAECRINDLLFPNLNTERKYSYNAPRKALKHLGHGDITTHGFRSSFKTWALEATNFPTQAIEYALAHETKNAVERAYIRGNKMLEKRREVMAAWEKYCDNSINYRYQ